MCGKTLAPEYIENSENLIIIKQQYNFYMVLCYFIASGFRVLFHIFYFFQNGLYYIVILVGSSHSSLTY